MKYGVGRWVQILDTGLLPGKLIQQLNGQTQRLIGQQSLAGECQSDSAILPTKQTFGKAFCSLYGPAGGH